MGEATQTPVRRFIAATAALSLVAAACNPLARLSPAATFTPTDTSTATATASSTITSTPSPTATPTSTPTPLPPTATPTPFPLPPPFTLVAGRPDWPPSLLVRSLSHGDTSRMVVYLTFDDGWGYADDVLRILQERRAPATACLVGQFITTNPGFVRHWVAAGLTLCNHTFGHPHLLHAGNGAAAAVREETMDEITRTASALQRVAPEASMLPYFRPPYGEQSDATRNGAATLGYRSILWSLDPGDWRPGLDATPLRDSVVETARAGDIILLHFEQRSTVEALPFIIDGLRERGFTLLGLESLPSDR